MGDFKKLMKLSIKSKENLFFIVLLLILGIVGVGALFKPGFYTSHDGRHQIIRLMHFHKSLEDGQFPVRWAGTALKGYGYPLFVFTYRLPFWLGEIGYLIFQNLGTAIKLAFIITYIASGLAMYIFAKKLWQNKFASFIVSLLYLWAPYRFSNIFVRAALGEATSFVFIPLVFFGLLSLKKGKKLLFWEVFTAFVLAGFLLSHAIALSLWAVPFLLWFLYLFISSKKRFEFFISSLVAGVLSLFLSAYYWLPAMLERKCVKFSGSIGDYYKAHFVTLKQLLYSKWGYGFSLPGTENDMMSFQVGLAQWFAFFAFLGLVFAFLLKKNFKLKLADKLFSFVKENLKLTSLFAFIFTISLFFQLEVSLFFYNFLKQFFVIDIPWRFLGVSVFSASLIAGGIFLALKNKLLKTLFVLLLFFLAFYTNRNHLKVNKYIYVSDSEYWQSTETSNEYNDYAPKDFNLAEFEEQDSVLETLSGFSINKVLQQKSNLLRFYSEVKSNKAEIGVKLAFYPGWHIFIDGEEVEPDVQNGRMTVDLEKGNHLITFIFKETNLRRFANWLSLLTLVFVAVFYIRYNSVYNKQ
jgi:hypothetical protein